MPRFQSAYSSGSSDRGQPACSTTTVRSPKSASAAAADSSTSGCAMSSKTRSRSASARRTSALGDAHPSAHRPDAAEPRRLHLLVEQALECRRSGRPGTMPPMIASGCPVASASSSQVARSPRPSGGAVAAATCTNFTTFQFADSAKYVGWSNSRHIPEMSPMSSSLLTGEVRVPLGVAPGPRGGCGRRRCARSVPPSLAPRASRAADHARAARRRPSRGRRDRRRRSSPPGAGGCASRTTRGRRPARRPESAPASASHTRWATSSPTGSSAHAAVSTLDRERVDPVVGRRVRGPRELRGRLRPAATARRSSRRPR